MPNIFQANLGRGIELIRRNPQILYTVFLGAIIIASFIFISQLFLDIVVETQERFEKHRLSSMHDAFVELAQRDISDTQFLSDTISELAGRNETITSFRVIQDNGTDNIIIASLDQDEINTPDDTSEHIYQTTYIDPDSSFSFEIIRNGDRAFQVVRAIVDTDGDVIGWVSTISSLSQFDQITKENIRTAYIVLFGIVVVIIFLFIRHARIIDYTTLYKRLKEVDTMKDDFVSMASHELRSPLTVIRGYADLLKGVDGLTEKDKENIRRIDLAAQDLDGLVADILDVSRLQQGRLEFRMADVDIAERVKEISESFALTSKQKGLSFVYKPEGTIPHVHADPDRLRQVLVNIIGNAVKYTQKGEVSVKLSASGEQVTVRVSDSGIGMSEEERKNLFGKFYRIQNEETKDIKGTGLGLWITKQIVEKMNGKISVESIKGVGSHFIVTFPKIQG
tara:strand:- start:6944 stop:8296 length:1353 start_codon:yes stop_codon:yes gene_type:complete